MEINKFRLSPVEKSGQRVLTTAQLAEAYETIPRRISENFNRNRNHFIEGIHYFCLKGEEKRKFFNNTQIAYSPKNVHTIYLWTERGALLHAKCLNTEKAWEVYEFLVDNYFHTREMIMSDNNLLLQINEIKTVITNQINDLNKRLDILEKKVNTIDKKVDSHADNIVKTLFDMSGEVIARGFAALYDKFFE